MQILGYKDPKKKIGFINSLKKELNTIIDSGALNNKKHIHKNHAVVSTSESKKIKLDQDGNVGKLKVLICVRGNLRKKKDPTMKGPHSRAVSMIMSKILMVDAARHKSRILQLGVSGALLQARMTIRVFITLSKVLGEVFP
jgi:hypothetical protein